MTSLTLAKEEKQYINQIKNKAVLIKYFKSLDEDQLIQVDLNLKWEFYAITFCLFRVFAYPGLIYRYFWRKRLN